VNERPISEDDLQAYVDERLEPPRQRVVAAYLVEHPEMFGRVADLMAQRVALRTAFAPIAAEPIPSRLQIRNLAAPRPRWGDRLRPLYAIAAALALTFAGGLGGWELRDRGLPPENGIGALAREAADSYSVYASDPDHPVEVVEPASLSRWIGSRLDRPVGVPNLSAAGYRLLGGRVVSTPHGPAGLYMYQDVRGARLGVLLRPMRIDRTAKMAEHAFGDVRGYSWADQGLGYSLVGAASASALHPLADTIRRQVAAQES
jgi:anti-sigma factor RsiW